MAVKRDIKYLNRDFTSLRDNLIEYSKTYFPNTYNDFSPSSPGMMFMEMAAYVGDVMSFYLDNQVQETFIQYARQTENLYDLAYLLGYKPKTTSVATVDLNFYQQVPAVSDGAGGVIPDYSYALLIPENTTVGSSTDSTVNFLVQDKIDFSYSSSSDPTTVTVYQTVANAPTYYLLKKTRKAISANIKTTTFTFNSPESFGFRDITDSNIIGILDIFDAEGNEWYEVSHLAQDSIYDSITNTTQNDPNFSGNADTPNLLKIKQVQNRFATRFLNSGSLRVMFGSGNPNDTTEEIIPNPDNVGLGLPFEKDKLTTAYAPTNFVFTNTYGVSPTSNLTVRYLVGGGVSANVAGYSLTNLTTTAITFVNSTIADSSMANTVFASLETNNLLAATGGGSGDTVEEIRQNSLGNYQNQLRAITADDYNIRALSMPSQYGNLAKIYTVKEKSVNMTPGEEKSTIAMYTLSFNADGTLRTASDALKQNLITYLSQYRSIGDSIKVKDAFIINIGINFDIIVLPEYNGDEVLTECISYLINAFNINNWQVNQPIILKNLYVELDKIEGVQTVKNIEIINNTGAGYSNYSYDVVGATYNNVVYPSIDPMIFEVKYPQTDIQGRIVSY